MASSTALIDAYAVYKQHADGNNLGILLDKIDAHIRRRIRISLPAYLTNDYEDVVQDVLVYVWEHLADCRGNITAWLNRMCHTRCLDLIRKKTAAHERYTDSLPEVLPQRRINSTVALPEGLTETERAITSLLSEGSSQQEIADTLGLTRKAVERRVARMKPKFLRQEGEKAA